MVDWLDSIVKVLFPWESAVLEAAGVDSTDALAPFVSPLLPVVTSPSEVDQTKVDTVASVKAARQQLAVVAGVATVAVAAPLLYAAFGTKKRKKTLTAREKRVGVAMENASAQATNVLMTGLASPVLSAAAAYILVQKLEDAQYITRGLGNAAQALMTVSAAGPMIQGIGGIATSAFAKGK